MITPEEAARKKRFSFLGPPKFDYTPSGLLTLRLHAYPAFMAANTAMPARSKLWSMAAMIA